MFILRENCQLKTESGDDPGNENSNDHNSSTTQANDLSKKRRVDHDHGVDHLSKLNQSSNPLSIQSSNTMV